MSSRRTIEHSPHYIPGPEHPLKFGKPPPKTHRGRRTLSKGSLSGAGKSAVAVSQSLGLVVPAEESETIASEISTRKRGWETYILDKGTGMQETIEGRPYTIGETHLVDVYIFPPGKPDGVRIGTVKGCRIVVIKANGDGKKDDSSDRSSRGWADIIVFKGVSRRQIEEPVQFDNGFGKSMIVRAQWSDIRRKR